MHCTPLRFCQRTNLHADQPASTRPQQDARAVLPNELEAGACCATRSVLQARANELEGPGFITHGWTRNCCSMKGFVAHRSCQWVRQPQQPLHDAHLPGFHRCGPVVRTCPAFAATAICSAVQSSSTAVTYAAASSASATRSCPCSHAAVIATCLLLLPLASVRPSMTGEHQLYY